METVTRNKLVRRMILLLMALSLTIATGASCDKEKKGEDGAEANSPSDKTGASKSPTMEKEGDDAQGEEVSADVYPGMNLSQFSSKERAKIVSIAKAELCPCEGSTVSLHECLSKQETQCHTAAYSAVVIAEGVQKGESQTDILNNVAKYVEGIKKSYSFDLETTPYRGNPDAKVVLVEFADFQCPHCKLVVPIMKEVSDKYGDKIAFYYKNYPLPMHPQAETAAQAALAAHKQGKFWPMHDLIFKNQTALSRAKLKGFAQQLGLNMNKFVEDFESPEIAAQVKKDMAEGKTAQLEGTPSLYINGKRYLGDKSTEAISAYIDGLLADDGKKKDDAPAEKKEGEEKEAEGK